MEGFIEHSYLGTEEHFAEMSFEDKKRMLKVLFDGRDLEGRRYGIYLEKKPGGEVHFTIRGNFPEWGGWIRESGLKTKVLGQE